jgi:hypothetical protein
VLRLSSNQLALIARSRASTADVAPDVALVDNHRGARDRALDDRLEDRLPGRDVGVDGHTGDAGTRRDGGDARRLAFVEERLGRVEDRLDVALAVARRWSAGSAAIVGSP